MFQKTWVRILGIVIAVAILVGAGTLIGRASYTRGYAAGIAENVGPENLEQFMTEKMGDRFGHDFDDDDQVGYDDDFGRDFDRFDGRSRRGGFFPLAAIFFLCLPVLFVGGLIAGTAAITRRMTMRKMMERGRGPFEQPEATAESYDESDEFDEIADDDEEEDGEDDEEKDPYKV